MKYHEFIKQKLVSRDAVGFQPTYLPDCMMPFQKYSVTWSLELGRAALVFDCGLGKTLMALVWAENILRHVGKRDSKALIIAPLAVTGQTVREGEKFGIKVTQTQEGKIHKGINITNFERLKNYNPEDFACVVVDEAGILKNMDGKMRKEITAFLHRVQYRLLCTATPAPNDYMELGTSSEALGNMPRNQMLAMFFTNGQETTQQWELKGHARKRFWQWVASWAKAARKPSDLGDFDDGKFILPKLTVNKFVLPSPNNGRGFFTTPANTLDEQRKERMDTLDSRCGKVAELCPKKEAVLIWCHLNKEGERLRQMIPDAVEVAGSDKDEVKIERLLAFSSGQIRILITKPKIAGFGMNWQHCHNVFYFPGHSHEAYYQAIRRCWRFGQKSPVSCNLVTTEREKIVLNNMLRKEALSDAMYQGIVDQMRQVAQQQKLNGYVPMEVPRWLRSR